MNAFPAAELSRRDATAPSSERSDTAPLLVRDYASIPDWDDFVESHPRGSIFHTSAMQRCEAKTKGRQPFATGAINSAGELCAILTAVSVSTLQGMASKFCTRSILYAEPLYTENEDGRRGVHQLIQHHDEFMKDRALFAEVRPVFLPYSAHEDPFLVNGYTLQGYVNYELCINANDQVLFEGLSPKRRNNVRSSLRRGVIVKESRSADATSLLYGLLSESHARSKLPLAHKSYFDAAIEQLPKQSCRILIAYHHGTPIAGGCFLAHKNRVTCWYAGTKRVSGIAATSLIFWEAIKLYSSLGYEIFDFAGGGWEGESYGPGKFKSKFGGEKIHTGRYRKIFAPRKLQIAEMLFKTFRSWLSP